MYAQLTHQGQWHSFFYVVTPFPDVTEAHQRCLLGFSTVRRKTLRCSSKGCTEGVSDISCTKGAWGKGPPLRPVLDPGLQAEVALIAGAAIGCNRGMYILMNQILDAWT